jgi:hypothetical protein
MGHYLPVFFFPIEKWQVPVAITSLQDALSLVQVRRENRGKFGLRESLSRNWWHQHLLGTLCEGLQINGLEFIHSEIACLCDDELNRASIALDEVLSRVADGIPNLSSLEDVYIQDLRLPKYKEALEQAKPALKINVDTDVGLEAIIGFYSFVKSLQEAAREAILAKQCLLYVQIQP